MLVASSQLPALSQPQQISPAKPFTNGQTVAKPTDINLLKSWFERYDEIRRKAQLSAKDKAKANELLAKGLAIIIPGDEKTKTQNF